MTPEEIIARALAKMDGYEFDDAAEEFSPGAEKITAALSAAGYVIVPKEPTEPVDPGAPKTNLARYADRIPPGGTIEEMHRRVTDRCGCQDRYKTCDCVSVFNKVLSDWWYEHNTNGRSGTKG